jgi:peptidoglycan/xylan/chitin deacetylase (PgdA/CDA1 family)
VSFALVLTYHAVERGPAPLCVDPGLFAEHLDTILASGARVVTVRGLAAALREGTLSRPTVAITFDDGFASVAENAAPLLVERGLAATVFCVAGRVGGRSNWPSARPGTFTSDLASERELSDLAAHGIEIGAHGLHHEPLIVHDERVLRDEILHARALLEERLEVTVESFAYPYGAAPSPMARRLVAETYRTACTTTLGRVGPGSDPHALPRVDAHYTRRPVLLERAIAGSLDSYLRGRRVVARVRRLVRRDYATATTRAQAAPS